MDRPYAIALLALWGSVATPAATSPEIGQLMREPASMLDMGLYRLRDSLSSFVNSAAQASTVGTMPAVTVQTSYDPGRNQIRILLEVPAPPAYLRRNKPTETCRQLVERVRTWMTADSGWTELFTHPGYATDEKRDAALREKLPGLVLIEARVDTAVSAPNRDIVHSCSGTLTSPVISYTSPPLPVP